MDTGRNGFAVHTESVSDYYYHENPRREVFKGKTIGMDNALFPGC